MTQRILSLFSGAGGIDEGLRQAGFRTKLAVELNPDCCATFRANHPDTEMLNTTVEEAISDRLLDRRFDIVVGGPPCQPHSFANPGRTNDDANIVEFEEAVGVTGPHTVYIENVPGAVPVLKRLSYNLYGLDTADYGVPQNRPRVISTTLPLPLPTHCEHGNHTLDGRPPLKPWVSVRDALHLDGVMSDHHWNYKRRHQYRSIDRPARVIPAGCREWIVCKNNDGSGNDRKRKPSTSPSHTVQTNADMWLLWDLQKRYPVRFRKHPPFRLDRPSGVITAKDYCTTDKTVTDGTVARKLTTRELATLQGFPDTYRWCGNKTSVVKQIGNALPPAITRHFFAKVRKTRR